RARVHELRPGAGPCRPSRHLCPESGGRRGRSRPLQSAGLVGRDDLHGDELTRPRRHGILAIGVGLLAVTCAQLAYPVATPIFDGVVVAEPYRYLAPPSGGAGSPTSADKIVPVVDAASPAF